MSTPLLKKIKESRREALVSDYITKIQKKHSNVKTADDLYQYLLLDTQISDEVQTSLIAEAISSLQLYINQSIEGYETELHQNATRHFSTDSFLSNWHDYNNRYARWAGNKKLAYYAADYISPTLRYNKTDLFKEFEQNINSNKLTEGHVYNALQKYLSAYEKLSYIDNISKINNGNVTYFIGRTKETPYQFYWRSLVVKTVGNDTINKWSPWHKIKANIGSDEVFNLWVGWERNRLYINWINKRKERNDDKDIIKFYYSNAYKDSDDTWVQSTHNYPLDLSIDNKIENTSSSNAYIYNKPFFDSKSPLPLLLTDNMEITSLYDIDHNLLQGKMKVTISDNKIKFKIEKEFDTKDRQHPGYPSYVEYVLPYKKIDSDGLKIFSLGETGRNNETTIDLSGKITFYSPQIFAPGEGMFISEAKPATYVKTLSITDVKGISAPKSQSLVDSLLIGTENLFNYDTQLNSITLDAFSESYGIYLWELFFHIPLLVSERYLNEQQFDKAKYWLKFIFSSAGYRDGDGNILKEGGNIRYWNSLPLEKDADWNDNTALASSDPDIIAMQDPMTYKLAIFMRTLDIYIGHGDQAYRQLERDTLAEAKLYYTQALQLLGPRPEVHMSHNWQNPSLKSAMIALHDGTEQGDFLPPYNEALLTYWDKLEIRLYNLRHNLNLDGQPLSLPLFATPVDPAELQRQHAAGNGVGSSQTNASLGLNSLYRFPLLLDRARAAVASVMQFGSTLNNVLERQDSEALTLLLQKQQQAVLKQVSDIQLSNIENLTANLMAFSLQITGTQQRGDHYQNLLNAGISSHENTAIDMRVAAGALNISSLLPLEVAGAVDLAPNIFGLADGGSRWGAVSHAIAGGMQITAISLDQGAVIHDVKANYQRRTEEWQLQLSQATNEVNILKEQQTGLKLQLTMAQKQADLAELEYAHAQTLYETQIGRFTNKELYNWMVGRLSGLYYQLYDATLSLCLMAKAALSRDIGSSKTEGILILSGWNDLYQGLLAGENLMLNLQKLENTWLIEDQRALEVERTISLSQIYTQLSSNPFSLSDTITTCIQSNKGNKGNKQDFIKLEEGILSVSISINGLKLSDDYPEKMALGNIRRIKQISVSLPALLGPYQDVQATLSFGGDNNKLAKGCTAIAISRGMNDSGQFQLDFNDGKYLPFEGININDSGALVLRFPNATDKQKNLLLSLSDIILHIRYTIRS
ncbi:neuraminidase-like domain-containing protein [Yersinia alsatica]|uniref:Tc toxin subunit A-related protein n=1 Tax=Yersinia alsatica TaxID=2890317 RepID=UPI0016437693|nr:neuraminidase-like domain-containing protein [Yersinia alsatica]